MHVRRSQGSVGCVNALVLAQLAPFGAAVAASHRRAIRYSRADSSTAWTRPPSAEFSVSYRGEPSVMPLQESSLLQLSCPCWLPASPTSPHKDPRCPQANAPSSSTSGRRRRGAGAARAGREHQQRHDASRRSARGGTAVRHGARVARVQNAMGGRRRASSAPVTSSRIIQRPVRVSS